MLQQHLFWLFAYVRKRIYNVELFVTSLDVCVRMTLRVVYIFLWDCFAAKTCISWSVTEHKSSYNLRCRYLFFGDSSALRCFFRKFSGLWPEIEIVVIAWRLCPTFWRSCISEHKVSQENIQDSGTMSKMGLKSVCWIQCEVNIGTCFVHVFGFISTTILYVKKYLLYV